MLARSWCITVHHFMHNTGYVTQLCGVFQEIDGDALLLLKSEMMMKYLGLKLGPALKLCYHIDRLRQNRLWFAAGAEPLIPFCKPQPLSNFLYHQQYIITASGLRLCTKWLVLDLHHTLLTNWTLTVHIETTYKGSYYFIDILYWIPEWLNVVAVWFHKAATAHWSVACSCNWLQQHEFVQILIISISYWTSLKAYEDLYKHLWCFTSVYLNLQKSYCCCILR